MTDANPSNPGTPQPGLPAQPTPTSSIGQGPARTRPSAAPDATTVGPMVPITETAGSRIGPYKLLQLIGSGGFGVVFMAEQQHPVRRKVALKIIKLGMDTRQVVARFEAERQALAVMDHPHIARVLDGGATDSGRPYFVMEYVVGDSVIKFADAHRLDITARLELFSQVCQAVQHAHQKGIIHRDLKPGNILASMVDGKPFARVIDFGIAKATGAAGGALTDKTLFTEHRQVMGTPEYMSPEQADGSPDIDTRTDIYALGVLLYELLTGVTPLDATRLRSAAWGEMQRIIREEEPLAPSLRLSRSLPTVAAAAQARHTDPAALGQRVRGELDWIALKALDKDRTRRYETARELAADVDRHLKGEPVVAAPPSAGYRLRKFVRRHKTLAAAMAALCVGLAVVSVVAAWAMRERGVAQAQTAKAVAAEATTQTALKNEARARAEATRQRDTAEYESTRANLGLARSAITNLELPQARAALETAPQILRNWEWRYLNRDAQRGLFAFKAHTDSVYHLAFSPDGATLATGSNDSTARLWDVASGTLLHTLSGHTSSVYHLAFSPDGAMLATGSYDITARLWNVASGTLLHTLRGHSSYVYHLAFSPDGATLATGSYDNTARLWNVASGTLLHTLRGHSSYVYHLAFSPDGATLATGSYDNTARLWDVASGTLIHTLRGHTDSVFHLAFSPDGATLATGSDDHTARLWDVASGTLLHTLRGPSSSVYHLAFSPDGATLATGSYDITARLWDAHTGTPLRTISTPGRVPDVWFAPTGHTLLTMGQDSVRAWDAATGKPLAALPADLGPQRPQTVNRTGTRMVSSAGNTALLIQLPPPDSAATSRGIDTGTASDTSLWSENQRVLVRTQPGGAATAFDTRSGQRLRELGPQKGRSVSAVSPDGECMVISTDDGPRHSVQLLPTRAGGPAIDLPGHTQRLQSAFYTKNGAQLATWDKAGGLRFWNVRTGEAVGEPIANVEHCQLTPDGTRLAWWGPGATRIHMVTMETGRELATLDGHTDPIDKVVFSTDSSRVATTDTAGIAQVYDTATGRQAAYFDGHAERVAGRENERGIRELTFVGADGGVVLSDGANTGGSSSLWNGQTGTLIPTLASIGDGYSESYTYRMSPGLHRIATNDGGAIHLLNAGDGRTIATLGRILTSGTLSDLAGFSPDGTLLAFLANQSQRSIVDARTGDTVCALAASDKLVLSSVSFTRNGHHLAAETDAGLVVWDTRTGIRVLGGGDGSAPLRAKLVASEATDTLLPAARGELPDVPLVVQRENPQGVSAFDLATGKETRLTRPAWGRVDKATATLDGARVLVETETGAHLCDTASGMELALLWVEPKGLPAQVVPHPDGRRLALLRNTRAAVDVEPFVPSELPPDERLDQLIGHRAGATALAFDASGARAATAGLDGTIRLWDVNAARELRVVRTGETGATGGVSSLAGTATALAFSPDGGRLAAGFADGAVREFDPLSDAPARQLVAPPPHQPGERGVAVATLLYTHDGARLAVWTGGPNPMGREDDNDAGSADGTGTPRGKTSASPTTKSATAGWFRLVDVASAREVVAMRALPPAIPHIALDHTGQRLVVVCEDGGARVIDTADGATLRTLTQPPAPGTPVYTGTGGLAPTGRIVSAAFGAQGRWIGTSGDDGRAAVWRDGAGTDAPARAAEGTVAAVPETVPVFMLIGHAANATSIAFHPDGSRAATTSSDGTVRVWDLERGREMLLLREKEAMLAAWFSPDGLWLVGRSASGGQIWNGTPLGWKDPQVAAPGP